MDAFRSLDLHDASITKIAFDWVGGNISIEASVFLAGRDSPARVCELMWSGVSRFVADRKHPWGPSNFINVAKFDAPSQYHIEMQSGDVLLIDAASFSLRNA